MMRMMRTLEYRSCLVNIRNNEKEHVLTFAVVVCQFSSVSLTLLSHGELNCKV